MREYIKLYINGKLHKITGESIFLPLSQYLRNSLYMVGTKESCTEGDCGACTILIGKIKDNKIKYLPVNSCICYVYQLDRCHIITIEGLKYGNSLNPVQKSVVENHGTQCGFCTPGIVTNLYSVFDSNEEPLSKSDIQEALTGNLCRCTGYEGIIDSALNVEQKSVIKLNELYPDNDLNEIVQGVSESIRVKTATREFIQPANLEEALQLKSQYPNATIIAGGTDIHVQCNKRDLEPESIISLANIEELKSIKLNKDNLEVGAGVTISEFEKYIPEIYPELHKLFKIFASPQIKNIATLAGNIANGSPVGDAIPFLMVMNAELELASSNSTRTASINNFYKGYKVFDLKQNEIITNIKIPLLNKNEILRLYKISKRKHLDISSFSAAIRMRKNNDIIEAISIAFGGVGPTVQRVPNIEAYLTGKKFSQETLEQAALLIKDLIKPISDVRGSENFRIQLAENCLRKFYFELTEELTCQM